MFVILILQALIPLTCALTLVTTNGYDEPMDFHCTGNTILSDLRSVHNNNNEDREWRMGCRQAPADVVNCEWTPEWVNQFDGPVNYVCPGNKFINGIQSHHVNFYEDRQWAFQCCEMRGKYKGSCIDTGHINDYDGPLTFTAEPNKYIVGMSSVHDNYYEDRVFDLKVCTF